MKGQENDTLDVLGRVCPYPLVLTKKKMEKMTSGQILKVRCSTWSTKRPSTRTTSTITPIRHRLASIGHLPPAIPD